jgi:MEMO1 family protein
MHNYYEHHLFTSAHTAYTTPLGEVPIDSAAVRMLDKQLHQKVGYGLSPIHQDREHSLEIELPFLQRTLQGEFTLLPVMIRSQTEPTALALGNALAEVLKGRNFLLVASTDLSHFYPQDIANKLDQEMLRRIAAFDPRLVLAAENEGKGFACGKGAVAAVLWAARSLGAERVKILDYATSGDISGDFEGVVGYGAAVCLGPTL